MLRYPGSNHSIEQMRLLQWGETDGGAVEFRFAELDSNEPTLKQSWIGSVEKYSEVVKRWPDLQAPRPGFGIESRRFIPTK